MKKKKKLRKYNLTRQSETIETKTKLKRCECPDDSQSTETHKFVRIHFLFVFVFRSAHSSEFSLSKSMRLESLSLCLSLLIPRNVLCILVISLTHRRAILTKVIEWQEVADCKLHHVSASMMFNRPRKPATKKFLSNRARRWDVMLHRIRKKKLKVNRHRLQYVMQFSIFFIFNFSLSCSFTISPPRFFVFSLMLE